MLTRWVDFWAEEEAPWSLALVRLLLGLALLGDYLSMGLRGLVVPLLTTGADGGLAARAGAEPALWQQLFGTGPEAAWGLYGALVVTTVMVAAGFFTRSASLMLLLLSAQFAWILPAGDRGIDMLSRNVLMIFVFAGSGQALSVDAWWARRRGSGGVVRIGAWARRLLLLQLVAMYWTAGVQKYAQQWWPWGDFGALWVIWQDWPMTAVATAGWVQSPLAWRFSQLATALTIGWEVSFPLILVAWYLLRTADRGGRWRAWVVRTRPDLAYAGLGVVFHLGIALWLDLGVFPWAMLALYPAFLGPDAWARWVSYLLPGQENLQTNADEVAGWGRGWHGECIDG